MPCSSHARALTLFRGTVGVAVLLLAACPAKEDAKPSASTSFPATPSAASAGAPAAAIAPSASVTAPSGPPGTLEGTVKYSGKVPELKQITRSSDATCAAAKPREPGTVVSKDGGLQDTLVRIAVRGAKGAAPAGKPPQIRQKDCTFVPYVLGVVAGQEIEITSSDNTIHNVHSFAGQETQFNVVQTAGAGPVKQTVPTATGVIKLKCDVHPWMAAWMVVTDHPFFVVTGTDGKFKLEHVPSGNYKLEAWHPKHGAKMASVAVEPEKSTKVDFAFADTDTPTE